LRPGGIVVFDDFSYPSIRSVCRYVLLNLHYKFIGPYLRESPERMAWRRLASRVRRGEVGPLLKQPLHRVLLPAWNLLLWRGGRLVRAPLRRVLPSRASVPDSELNLPDGVNYVALQKLGEDDRHWTHHIPF
jgi:hypothetical protein